MQLNEEYDVAIIGGGLAGLAASIQLVNQGHSVVLFEKEKYPFHKVCGEYISLESWNFLNRLGLPLAEINPPIINTLFLTSPNGKAFTTKLPLGGFGISRYRLDFLLANIARQNGVHLFEETKVGNVVFDEGFDISFHSKKIRAKICLAAYGKRSNLDIRWKRSFLEDADKRLDNYVGIKYHIKTDWQTNVIGLHNFQNGYCGISKIEDNKYCLCYMTNAENLKMCDNNIEQLEETVLFRNTHLKKIFLNSEKCYSSPVTISQINFDKKTQVENHLLMLGDSAGMIAPLCGNGMSIALHTSKIASALTHDFLQNKTSRSQLEDLYKKRWSHQFAKRLQTGRTLQRFFGSEQLSNLFVGTFNSFPFLAKPVIKMTHGKPF
jgi:menaquinone-9 beta-reductase